MAHSRISEKALALGYQAKRGATFVAARESLATLTSEATIKPALGAFAWMSTGIGGVVLLGGLGGISAYFAAKDYDHRLDDMTKMYDEELCAKLGKKPKELTREDLKTLAYGDPSRGIQPNYTLADHLAKERTHRNFDIAFSVISSLAAFAVVHTVVAGALATLAPGLVAAGAMGFIATAAVKGVAGFFTFRAIKKPLGEMANKLFNVERETAHDHITALTHCVQKGVEVSRDHVLSVFISANPVLQNYVREKFGDEFEKLDLHARSEATKIMSKNMPIDELTDDINSKRINATELAFAVQGDRSGVMHDDFQYKKPKGIFAKAVEKVASVFKHQEVPEEVKLVEKRIEETNFVAQKTGVSQDGIERNELPQTSQDLWTAKVGRRNAPTHDRSHTQRLEEQSAAHATMQGGLA